MPKIKVDVISGFLGAGKTTLLSMYAAYRIKLGEKIAIIENEFGEIGIDSLFLKNKGLSVHEIVNGCICCSLKGDIIATLKNLAAEGNINRVLIEPTGIFMLNEIYEIVAVPDVYSNYEIGTVVTVVDAKNYLRQKNKYTWFFTNQIKWAHRIVLSKTGLVDRDTVLETIQSIQNISDTPDIEAGDWKTFEEGDWERIFYSNNSLKTDEYSQNNNPEDHESFHKSEHGHDCFAGISIPCNRTFSEYSLEAKVKMLSTGLFGDIPRAKGIVADENNGSIEFDFVDGDIVMRHRAETIEKKFISFIGIGIQKGVLSMLFDDTYVI